MKRVHFSNNTKKHDGLHPYSDATIFIYLMYFSDSNNNEIIKIFALKSSKDLLYNVILLFKDLINRYISTYNNCLIQNNFNKSISILESGAGYYTYPIKRNDKHCYCVFQLVSLLENIYFIK